MLSRISLFGLAALSSFALARPHRFRLPSRDLSFDYNDVKVWGVNLGGWLVAEPWITPSLFESAGDSAVDEWTLGQALGGNGQSVMEAHWGSWITQGDIANIAAAGFNHLRIPIGYWSIIPIAGEPYVYGALAYLDEAVGWARGAGLKVEVDIHGLPGSQNGFDNSGHRGAVLWGTDDTVNESLDVVQFLAERYVSDTDVVTIINLVNEPLVGDVPIGTLEQYYNDGFGRIRAVTDNIAVNINDGFQGISFWQSWGTSFDEIMLSVHYYQIFDSGELELTPPEHVAAACATAGGLASSDKWTLVSEWTGAQTDCAKYLNGRGLGARYDGTYPGSSYIGSCDGKYTGTVDGLSSDDKYNIRTFNEAQLDAYDARTGWFFWTWKTESSPEWDLQAQIAGGLFPQPITSREYPGQCG